MLFEKLEEKYENLYLSSSQAQILFSTPLTLSLLVEK